MAIKSYSGLLHFVERLNLNFQGFDFDECILQSPGGFQIMKIQYVKNRLTEGIIYSTSLCKRRLGNFKWSELSSATGLIV